MKKTDTWTQDYLIKIIKLDNLIRVPMRLLPIFLLINYHLFAQSPKIDSLKTITIVSQNDSIVAEAYFQITKLFWDSNPDSGLYYANVVLDMGKEMDHLGFQAAANSQFAWYHYIRSKKDSSIYYWDRSASMYEEYGQAYKSGLLLSNIGCEYAHLGKYKEAITYLDKAMKIANEKDSIALISSCYVNYGLVFDYQGNVDSGYYYYNAAREIGYELQDTGRIAAAENNIGVMYYYFEDYRKSLEYFHRVLKFYRKNNDIELMSDVLINMGTSYEQLNMLDSAMYFHKEGIRVDSITQNSLGLGRNYHNIGVIAYRLKDYKNAKNYFEKAIQFKKKSGVERDLITSYQFLAELLIIKKNYSSAKPYLDQADQIAVKVNSLEDLKETKHYYSKYYEGIGDYKNALASFSEYKVLSDSIYAIEKVNKINELETNLETKQKEAEIKLLKSEKSLQVAQLKNQRWIKIIWGLLAMLAGLVSWNYFNKFKRVEEEKEDLIFKLSEIGEVNGDLKREMTALNEKIKLNEETLNKVLVWKDGDKTHHIPFVDILYAKSEDKGVRIFLKNGKSLWSYGSLKKVLTEAPAYLVQIHKSCIANKQHIAWINTKTISIQNGEVLPLGRTYKENLKGKI